MNLIILQLIVLLQLFLFGISIEACSSYKKESKIKLEKNGYTNIMIGIEEGVPENRLLIENIKSVFTEASEFLFNITK
jgi:hypothetical protein